MDILRARFFIIKIYWILEEVGALSPSLYLLELAPKSLCIKRPRPLIIIRSCLDAFKSSQDEPLPFSRLKGN